MAHLVKPIKITANGETYVIKNLPNNSNPQLEEQNPNNPSTSGWNGSQSSAINNEQKNNDQNNNWTDIRHNKKRKTDSSRNVTKVQKWLQAIPLSNTFSSLEEAEVMDSNNKTTSRNIKPPPIYIDAQIIDPLIELLNHTAGTENYTIKQIKLDQVKIQTNIPEIYHKVTQALRQKNAAYHTYQLKTEKNYKIVIRGLHPRTNITNIRAELAKLGHEERTANNMTKYDTKQPLPLFLIELEPKNNNKDIFNIHKILHTIVNIEPPRHKKDIPQCIKIICHPIGPLSAK
ncbi:Nucleic-acid-binding protein from transposon X-element [Anthophora quadrimaculata]